MLRGLSPFRLFAIGVLLVVVVAGAPDSDSAPTYGGIKTRLNPRDRAAYEQQLAQDYAQQQQQQFGGDQLNSYDYQPIKTKIIRTKTTTTTTSTADGEHDDGGVGVGDVSGRLSPNSYSNSNTFAGSYAGGGGGAYSPHYGNSQYQPQQAPHQQHPQQPASSPGHYHYQPQAQFPQQQQQQPQQALQPPQRNYQWQQPEPINQGRPTNYGPVPAGQQQPPPPPSWSSSSLYGSTSSTSSSSAVDHSTAGNTIATTEYYTNCPAHYTGPLPILQDCRRYLDCWQGQGSFKDCPPETGFNARTLQCDHLANVDCHTLHGVTGLSAGLGASGTVGGGQQQQHRHNGAAAGGHNSGRFTDISSEEVPAHCPPGATGLQPHPNDCTKFLNCGSGNMHVQECGPGTAYSIPLKVCDYKGKVDCSGRGGGVWLDKTATGSHHSAAIIEERFECPPNTIGNVHPHPRDCTKFLNCDLTGAVVQSCGPGTAFDPVHLVCDYAEKVQCGTTASIRRNSFGEQLTEQVDYGYNQAAAQRRHSSTTSTTTTTTTIIIDIMCPANVTGHFPHPFDYKRFLNCRNGQTAVQNCPARQVYSISRGICDRNEAVQRLDRVNVCISDINYEYSQTLTECPPNTIGYHLYPYDGAKYVECVSGNGVGAGKMIIRDCPRDHLFSLSRQVCVPQQDSGATDHVRSMRENLLLWSGPTDSHDAMLVLCPSGTSGLSLYPYPFDAMKYIACSGGGRIRIETCPARHVFSLSQKACQPKEQLNANDWIQVSVTGSSTTTTSTNHGSAYFGKQQQQGHAQGVNMWESRSTDVLSLCPPNVVGVFVHPFDCTKYVFCQGGEGRVENCATGQVFSISKKLCISRDKVVAYDRVEYRTSTTNEFSDSSVVDSHGTGFGFGFGMGVGQDRNGIDSISCPPGFQGLIAHPSDFTKYVQCSKDGRAVVESCMLGMVFSVSRGYCDFGTAVSSNDRSGYARHVVGNQNHAQSSSWTDTNTNTNEQTSQFGGASALPASADCPPGVSGMYPHPGDCTKYLNCANGKTNIMDCGPGTAWQEELQVCDFLDKVKCGNRPAKAQTTQTGQTTGWINNQIDAYDEASHRRIGCPEGITGFFVHPFDQTKYFICQHGRTVIQSCNMGLIFSISRKQCAPDGEVPRTDRVVLMEEFLSETNVFYLQQSGYISCPSGAVGLFLYPFDCGKYMRCEYGRTYVEECPPQHFFSISKQSCSPRNKVETTDRVNTMTEIQQLYVEHLACPPGMFGLLPHPYSCHKYLNCGRDGQTHIEECGPNRVFSLRHQQCELEKQVGEDDRISIRRNSFQGANNQYRTGTTTRNTVSMIPNFDGDTLLTCPEQASGLYAHPEACNKFVQCVNGMPYVQDCGPGTAWNAAMQVCDFEHSVQCNLRSSKELSHLQEAVTCPAGFTGLLPHPTECTKYLNCDKGQAFTRDCAPGTGYNPQTSMCDYMANIECPPRRQTGQQIGPHREGKVDQQWNQYGGTAGASWSGTEQSYGSPATSMNQPRPSSQHHHGSTKVTTVADHTLETEHKVQEQWNGSGSSSHTATPTKSVLHQSGSLRPNQNFLVESNKVYSTPLAPFAETFNAQGRKDETITATGTNVYYAQAVGSQENSEEVFNPTSRGVSFTQGQVTPVGTNTNGWNPSPQHPGQYGGDRQNSPTNQGRGGYYAPLPNQNLMPPLSSTGPTGPGGAYDQRGIGSGPIAERLLPPLQSPGDSFGPGVVMDGSNLYGGLLPPKPTQAEPFGQPPQSPQISPPPFPTAPTNGLAYPQQDPHYSPSYSGVAHSSNTTWNQGGLNGATNQRTGTPPPYNRNYYNTSSTTTTTTSSTSSLNSELGPDGQQLPISDALRMLLRPYMNRSGTVSEEAAAQAESHIMHLGANTNTHTSELDDTQQQQQEMGHEDVEFIVAGEQQQLVHNPSMIINASRTPQDSDAAKVREIPNPHQHGHHQHGHHQHSRQFHQQHPHLPNPFAEKSDAPDSRRFPEVDPFIHPRMAGGPTKRAPAADCEFDCGNGKCVRQLEVCDGIGNCGNRRDELNCDHLGYEVRLSGSDKRNQGRIEVKISGKWGYVCDDKFGLPDADVVCRELGFKLGALEVRDKSHFSPTQPGQQPTAVRFHMDEVQCRGNETHLKDCDFNGWGVSDCGSEEVVGVVCKVQQMKCPQNYWLCTTSEECIPPDFVCDNTPDCADKSDESDAVCNSEIKYRLEGGRSVNEGRLEVKYRNEWGTVCDDDFGLREARVACNSMGYYGEPAFEKNIYGPANGPIWLDQVACVGNETSIDKCTHWNWGEHNCNHTEDVSLRCTVGAPPNKQVVIPTADVEDDYVDDNNESTNMLEDIGVYPSPSSAASAVERSSKYLRNSQRRCGHFKANMLDEYAHPQERVINGSTAQRGRHPWQATIRTRGRGGISSHWCGAVLISKQHLVTAAHCLSGYPKGAYFVRLGDHYANIAETSEVDGFIENWYIHEKFRKGAQMNHDIAVVVLKQPLKFNDYIQPVCLPDKKEPLTAQRMCTISGWGSIKSGVSTPSNILRAAELPVIADETCAQDHIYGEAMTENMFCAGYLDHSSDACDGDSGGPFVCSDHDGETLYGIISWGQHCGHANKPGVYVRVERYVDWIYEKIQLSLQQMKARSG